MGIVIHDTGLLFKRPVSISANSSLFQFVFIFNPNQMEIESATEGGVPGTETPKIQALPEWGGSDPCLDFCEGFVHMH